MDALARLLAIVAAAGWAASAMPVAAAGHSLATSAWRCGAEGRVYSDTPCAGGREIELPAPRPAADVRAAERLAQREAALAERLKREREARDAAALAANARPVSLGPAPRAEVPKRQAHPQRLERQGLRSEARLPGATRATAPRLTRPQRPQVSRASRVPAIDPDAGGRTWQATAPASPRAPG